MKKIRICLLIALLNVGIAVSQPPQNGGQRMTIEERVKRNTEWMTKELNLTQEQIVLVDSVNVLFTKVQQAYIQAVDGDRNKIRDAMLTLNQEKEEALAKILTNEQLEHYKIKVQEMINSRGIREGRQ